MLICSEVNKMAYVCKIKCGAKFRPEDGCGFYYKALKFISETRNLNCNKSLKEIHKKLVKVK